jgi:hypothetical protein
MSALEANFRRPTPRTYQVDEAKARFDIICADWRGADPDFVAVRLSLTQADLGAARLAGCLGHEGRSVRQ